MERIVDKWASERHLEEPRLGDAVRVSSEAFGNRGVPVATELIGSVAFLEQRWICPHRRRDAAAE